MRKNKLHWDIITVWCNMVEAKYFPNSPWVLGRFHPQQGMVFYEMKNTNGCNFVSMQFPNPPHLIFTDVWAFFFFFLLCSLALFCFCFLIINLNLYIKNAGVYFKLRIAQLLRSVVVFLCILIFVLKILKMLVGEYNMKIIKWNLKLSSFSLCFISK